MLIGFTVMQHAFAGGALAQGLVSDAERKALALAGSGDTVFDWDVTADRVYVSPEVETHLGLKRGALEGPAASWLEVMHPFDRDRFRATLDAVLEQRRGRVHLDFRLKTADGALLLVHDEGAPGRRLGWRSRAGGRHAGATSRSQDGGGAHPA